jgi:hypothetical protein
VPIGEGSIKLTLRSQGPSGDWKASRRVNCCLFWSGPMGRLPVASGGAARAGVV